MLKLVRLLMMKWRQRPLHCTPVAALGLIPGLVLLVGFAAAPRVVDGAHVTAERPLPRMFRIGTGGVHGTYFPVGGLIAKIVNESIAQTAFASQQVASAPVDETVGVARGVVAAAQVSNGSVSNVADIDAGNLEAALVQADVAYWAYTGTELFKDKGKQTRLRAIANLYPETVHLVARKGSGIVSVADLAGHSVSLDEPGSGTLVAARIILGALDAQVEPVYLKPQFATKKLASGELDALFIVAGHPTKAILSLAEETAVNLVPIHGPQIDNMLRTYPYFSQVIVPVDTYPGVGRTPSVAVGAQLLVAAELDDEVIYQVTKALWSQDARSILDNGHRVGKEVRIEKALEGIGIPLHPGAARYYREVGRL